MLTLNVTEKGGTPKRMEFDKDEVTVGRVPGNDIVLPKGVTAVTHGRAPEQGGSAWTRPIPSSSSAMAPSGW